MTSTRDNQRGLGLVAWIILILVLGILLLAGYIWLMLSWSYSSGERAGWVQKLSKKGYICKTWEGEMVMVSLPGSIPEKFFFTIRDDRVAERVNAVMGKRVALNYEEHIGLLTSCFGDTGHFVTDVKAIDETPAPLMIPSQRPTQPAASQQQTPATQ
ncbi:MAG TPA: hypothetical protein VMH26_07250 [Burkholderiales bacterium]|nr:hypothetical protein [Burkholderiales bacterium]